jgi:hypothetical protein
LLQDTRVYSAVIDFQSKDHHIVGSRVLKDAVYEVLREEQCGFRKERGCVEQIFILREKTHVSITIFLAPEQLSRDLEIFMMCSVCSCIFHNICLFCVFLNIQC